MRQGDPISSYLFVLCMEHLAHLINIEVENGNWKPIPLKKNGLSLTCLFFLTDDLILFVEASLNQVDVIKGYLDRFYRAFGQCVSMGKTLLHCSKNAGNSLVNDLCKRFGFKLTNDLGKHLGVPFHHLKVNSRTYEYLIDSI